MAVCSHCSAKNLPGAEVCKACGDVLPEELDPDRPDAMLGRVIADKYEILGLIGEGAMGRVYEAKQTSLDKHIAIKVLHRRLANDPKVAKRFHREARAASRLSHPSSLHILDFGEAEDGTLYIAMELLDGDDLLAIIEEDAPLTPRRIGHLLRQVLSALDAAHHAGIIHRDLKPENVVVLESPSGEEHVKVCDFGIAKIQEAEGGSAITVSGFVCGTPEYMAPEQARGEELDPRADLYACGCMLYQLLTAMLPFKAESALGIITKHLTEKPIPPRERRPEWNIPPVLEDVALKAMEKDRDRRYPDAVTMSEALREAVKSLGDDADKRLGQFTSERPTTPTVADVAAVPAEPPRSVGWAIALVVLGASAVGFALYSQSIDDAPRSGNERTGVHTVGTSPGDDDAVLGASQDASVDPIDASRPSFDAGLTSDVEATSDPDTSARRRRRRTDRDDPVEGEAVAATEVSPGRSAYDDGRRLFLANDVTGAIREFERAARLMPDSAEVQKQLGRAYMRSGNVPRANASYRRYLELTPSAPDRAIIERLINGE